MIIFPVFFALYACHLVQGRHDTEFPQWSLTNWIVPSRDVVILDCYDDSYYPFNDPANFVRAEWILPERAAYLHLPRGEVNAGWSVGDDYALTITKSNLNVPEAADGMYVCAALAKIAGSDDVYAWHYLRWGVGLYADVAAMNDGGIERYGGQFLVAGIAVLVYAVCIILLAMTIQFRYKGGPPPEKSGKEFESDYDRKSQVSVDVKDNFYEVL